MNKYYTGIGSRSTPIEIGEKMNKISLALNRIGYTLRSGGADGADTFFETNKPIRKDIYLPWRGFNSRVGIVPKIEDLHYNLLREIHPSYDRLKDSVKRLHFRNINQVLGCDLNTPSDFLICWAEVDSLGNPKGGTRTAWMVAKKYNIPCFNIYLENDMEDLKTFLKGINKKPQL